jgi:hypothetical protein
MRECRYCEGLGEIMTADYCSMRHPEDGPPMAKCPHCSGRGEVLDSYHGDDDYRSYSDIQQDEKEEAALHRWECEREMDQSERDEIERYSYECEPD